jgi:hypothetical protein
VSKVSKETKELTKQLKALNANIDTLNKVTAVNIGKEEIFKGKETKEEKIEALYKIGLPRTLIAIIVGSTPESVSALKSMKKPKSQKQKTENTSEGVKENDE